LEDFPSISELAALYLDVTEMEAISYLIGPERSGAECYLDKESFKLGDNERYPKPSVYLKNEDDLNAIKSITKEIEKKYPYDYVVCPSNFNLIPSKFERLVKIERNKRRKTAGINDGFEKVGESDEE
jgi:hypothetical protein